MTVRATLDPEMQSVVAHKRAPRPMIDGKVSGEELKNYRRSNGN